MRTFIFTLMLLAASQLAWGQGRMSARQASRLVKVEAFSLDSTVFDLDSVSVDMLPEFPGSTLALLEYLNKEMRYPKAAWKQGVAGEVVARFVITADGHVDEVEVVRSLDPICDDEVVRAVETLPQWTPGVCAGRGVPVGCTVTVRFGG